MSVGSTRDVIVRFSPSSAGSKTALLRVVSDDPDESEYDITLNGTGTAPDISLSPTSWNYGNVITGNSNTNNFVISNTGSATLNISATNLTGTNASEFSIISGGGSFSIPASGNHTVQVQFAPATTGSKSASLQITSDDPDESPFYVTLSGTGMPQNTAPVVSIPDQTISEGASFATINLDNCVTDDHTADANLSWTYSGNSSLAVNINSSTHIATISVPNQNWNGSE